MLSLLKHVDRTTERSKLVRSTCFGRLSMITSLEVVSQLTHAQQPAPRVYAYVEQMPQLPSGGGQQQIAMDIMKRLLLSGSVEPSCYRVVVYFEVNPTGVVQHARIMAASQSAVVDSALLQSVRSLPKLHPGYQPGKPVTVSFKMPFNVATQ